MSYPATPAALVKAIETKLADNLPPTQIVREIQGIIDHYKTTLTPDDQLILRMLTALDGGREVTLTTVDGRTLRLEDFSAEAGMLVALIRDETLGSNYEARIRTAIETEPI